MKILRPFVSVLFLALLLGGCGEPPSDLDRLRAALPPAPGANVILISFDALRADALGLHGYPKETSPNLDAFGAESLVFDRAYTVAPVTPTSFAAAFTGFLPTRVFHRWNLTWDDSLAARFTAAGYRTAGFMNNLQLSEERNFHTGFEHYVMYQSTRDETVLEESLAWLEENRDQQIFAWIHFLNPHAPYEVREMASHFYDPNYEGAFERTTWGLFETDDPKEIQRIRNLYDGEVFYIDDLFGRMIEGLEERGLLENSIIVVTSDHGEEFMEHGGFQHDRLTEEHVHIPLILRHPTAEPLRSPVLVSNVDLFPTLLSLVGESVEGPLDGRDLTTLTQDDERVVGISMTGSQDRWLSLRKAQHKMILTCMPEKTAVLYDLEEDPGETRNYGPERPGVLRDLLGELDVILGGDACEVMQAAVSGADPTRGLSPEIIEGLKALGYLGD